MGVMRAKNRVDFTVLGATVNLRVRLCSKADPDQVLIDAATHEAGQDMSGITFESLKAIRLKGYADPVPTFGVTSKVVTADAEAKIGYGNTAQTITRYVH